MNERDRERDRSEGYTYEELVKSGDVFADDDPVFLALKDAARKGLTQVEGVGSKKLTEKEEHVADEIRKEAGLGPEVVRRETPVSVSVRLQPSTIRLLTDMAEELGYWHGGKGSISTLLDAIGVGKLIIVPYGTAT